MRSFRELLTRISRRTTVVLLIDDLQLSDRDSVDLLTELLGAENSPPLLLLACYRGDEGDLGLVERIERIPATERRVHRTLAVNDLSEQDARALAVQELGLSGQPFSEDAGMLVRESGGNPFLLLELAWQLRTHRRGRTGAEQADEILWNRVRRLPEPCAAAAYRDCGGGAPAGADRRRVRRRAS